MVSTKVKTVASFKGGWKGQVCNQERLLGADHVLLLGYMGISFAFFFLQLHLFLIRISLFLKKKAVYAHCRKLVKKNK